MSYPRPPRDQVAAILEALGRDVALPRFRALRADEITAKATAGDTQDLVTVVDHLLEERLTEALGACAPGVPVLGEEAAHRDPARRALLDLDTPLWVVDPIDGTRNFAQGDADFGIMVSWVEGGRAVVAWVHLPARGETFVAEAGAGVFLDGVPVRVPAGHGTRPPRGMVSIRFLPPDERERHAARLAGRYQPVVAPGAAAVSYTDIVRGKLDFLVYYRLLPWDHGAPALVLTEAGGCVRHLDGRTYTIRSHNQVTVVARDAELADEVRGWLTGADGEPPVDITT